jgi:hypothetical protein
MEDHCSKFKHVHRNTKSKKKKQMADVEIS